MSSRGRCGCLGAAGWPAAASRCRARSRLARKGTPSDWRLGIRDREIRLLIASPQSLISKGLRNFKTSQGGGSGAGAARPPPPDPPPWGGVEGPKAPPHLPRDDLDFPDP